MESREFKEPIVFTKEESLHINISALEAELKRLEATINGYDTHDRSKSVIPEKKEFYIEQKVKTEEKLNKLLEELENLKK